MVTVKTYALDLDRNGTLRGICGKGVCDMGETPAEELDAKTRDYMARHGEKNYVWSMRAVLHNEPDLKVRYAGLAVRGLGEAIDNTPAAEADRRVRVYMRETGEKDYGVALRAILAADSNLRDCYALGRWVR